MLRKALAVIAGIGAVIAPHRSNRILYFVVDVSFDIPDIMLWGHPRKFGLCSDLRGNAGRQLEG